MSVRIRRVTPAEWREYREIRLRMLADTPMAYGETVASASTLPDDEWRRRAERGEEPGNVTLVAVDDAGVWVGMMRGQVSAEHGPMLAGVFVDPSVRGSASGVADALLDGIVSWAGAEGTTLALEVHAENERAIRFYARRGFAATGRTQPFPLPPYGHEIEMRMELDAGV